MIEKKRKNPPHILTVYYKATRHEAIENIPPWQHTNSIREYTWPYLVALHVTKIIYFLPSHFPSFKRYPFLHSQLYFIPPNDIQSSFLEHGDVPILHASPTENKRLRGWRPCLINFNMIPVRYERWRMRDHPTSFFVNWKYL